MVTGCNQGIGYGIVQKLLQKNEVPHIIMACRDTLKATAAKTELAKEYPIANEKLEIAEVDLASYPSIWNFVTYIRKNHG